MLKRFVAILCLSAVLALGGISYSFELLNKASAGDAEAQFELGVCYDFGYGVYENDLEAVIWYHLAAMQGHVEAQYFLACAYDEGKGIDRDPKEAFSLYKKAALQGHTLAQYNLGVCYFSGEGVKRDNQEAYYWLLIAASNGDDTARESLGDVGQQLTPEQRTQTQSRALDWIREHNRDKGKTASADSLSQAAEDPDSRFVELIQYQGAFDFPLSSETQQKLQAEANTPLNDPSLLALLGDRLQLTAAELTRICLKSDGRLAINSDPGANISSGKLAKTLKNIVKKRLNKQPLNGKMPLLICLVAAEDESQTAAIAKVIKTAEKAGFKHILVRRAGNDPANSPDKN